MQPLPTSEDAAPLALSLRRLRALLSQTACAWRAPHKNGIVPIILHLSNCCKATGFATIVTMIRSRTNPAETDKLLARIRSEIEDTVQASPIHRITNELAPLLGGGMLRSRMALHVGRATAVPENTFVLSAAGVEMLHEASLLHDDLVDGGLERRGCPALWIGKGTKAAVLAGDILVVRGIRCLRKHSPHLTDLALEVLQDMCEAETEQELLLNGSDRTWKTYIANTRRKTGGLFGLAACVGADTPDLIPLLHEAGIRVGTAYQLADDLLDAYPSSSSAGKTLGTDVAEGRLTAATTDPSGSPEAQDAIRELLSSSSELLTEHTLVHDAWTTYVNEDITPAITRLTANYSAQVLTT